MTNHQRSDTVLIPETHANGVHRNGASVTNGTGKALSVDPPVLDDPDATRAPAHIAIIMDGNGRWAARQGLPRLHGHERGTDNIRRITEAAGAMGVKYLTLWAFSTENWRRPADEIQVAGLVAVEPDAAGLAPEEIDEETIARFLFTRDLPDPDLVIRTSGEYRMSNFLIWQAAYAELFFTPVLWPDFGPDELKAAIAEYCQRDRRFGRVSAAITGS